MRKAALKWPHRGKRAIPVDHVFFLGCIDLVVILPKECQPQQYFSDKQNLTRMRKESPSSLLFYPSILFLFVECRVPFIMVSKLNFSHYSRYSQQIFYLRFFLNDQKYHNDIKIKKVFIILDVFHVNEYYVILNSKLGFHYLAQKYYIYSNLVLCYDNYSDTVITSKTGM